MHNLLFCLGAIAITLNQKGPFNLSTTNENLINLEIFLFSVSISILGMASFKNSKFLTTIRLILICGWGFWSGIYYNIHKNHEQKDAIKILSHINFIENRIKEKMEDYIQILKSGKGLFMSSNEVDGLEWRQYVQALNLESLYSGMNGMGVVYPVSKEHMPTFIKKIQKEYYSEFSIKILPQDYYFTKILPNSQYIITHIEPLPRNLKALGLDLSSELERKNAADQSIMTGNPTISNRIQLIQDNKKRYGFLMFLPVYKKGTNPQSTKERVQNFTHWIYAPFIFENFMKSVFAESNVRNIVFEFYDHDNFSKQNLLYAENIEVYNANSKPIIDEIRLGDKVFFIRWSKGLHFTTSNDFLSTWIGLIGSVSVILIAMFAVNLLEMEEKSKEIALRMNQNFLDSQIKIKEQEHTMIESRKMATLGEMASSIAHEINNPLAVINGNLHLLKRNLNEEHGKKYVQKIEETVFRIDKIIKGMKLFSRDATFDPMSQCALKDIIDDTLFICSERLRIANIKLTVDLKFHGNIECRATQISQVIINLINNSYDALQSLDEKWITIDTEQSDQFVIIKITDSGKGIPASFQQKILEPFFTTKEVGKGTGLGLSISKGIIDSHNGFFSINSLHPNTQFIISLPISISNSFNVKGEMDPAA